MCPSDITQNTDSGSDSANVTFAMRFTDNVDEQPMANCTYLSGTQFPFGETIVTCNVSDSSNNINNCSFLINVTGKKSANNLQSPFLFHSISRADMFKQFDKVMTK